MTRTIAVTSEAEPAGSCVVHGARCDRTAETLGVPAAHYGETVGLAPLHQKLGPVPCHEETLGPVPCHEETLEPVPCHEERLEPVPCHEETLEPVPCHEDRCLS
ncbi:unnamed protein product [Lampetra planeri]